MLFIPGGKSLQISFGSPTAPVIANDEFISNKKKYLANATDAEVNDFDVDGFSQVMFEAKVFDSVNELNEIVKVYHSTRNKVLKILKNIPLIKFSEPQGSFYFYIDIQNTKLDSFKFVNKLMLETGVVLTPGIDFDKKFGSRTVRLSFSSKQDLVVEAVERIHSWFRKNY